jgi:hypothetical protein
VHCRGPAHGQVRRCPLCGAHSTRRCESGCECKPRYASGFTELPESTIYLVQLHTTPNRNCTVVVINDSEPGGK